MIVVEPHRTISLMQAAEQLGMKRDKAYRLAREGKIPGLFKMGASYRVSVLALESFLADPSKYRE